VFHGAGSDPESMIRATGFDALADTTPMLVVYLRARSRALRYQVDPPPGRVSEDVLFVDALLERLRARFRVDAGRIWATGFSNGAALCYRLAAERPDVFAAIAPVAGYLPRHERAEPVVPVPLLHVHGTEDVRVGAPGADGPGSAVATWARWNGATALSPEVLESEPGGLAFRRRTWTGATPRSDAALLLVEGQGHVWPGGPGGGVSRAILAFLRAHPRDAAPSPLVGQPLGALPGLRWLTPDGRSGLPTRGPMLVFWWPHPCPDCPVRVPALVALADRHGTRALRLVGVHLAAAAPPADEDVRARLAALGVTGPAAVDADGRTHRVLSARAALGDAPGLTLLVDANGVVRWVHPGPGLAPGSAPLAELEALVARFPAAPAKAAPR
jgi:poly(3-hydroxybutyrate) depolymerase